MNYTDEAKQNFKALSKNPYPGRGIILGTWKDCAAPSDFSLRDVFLRAFGGMGIPVVAGLQCGHSVPSAALPLGMRVEVTSAPEDCRIIIK